MRFVLLLLVLILSAGRATAQDLVAERGILDDPAGLMTVADVKGAAFAPADEVVTRILNPSVFWLRLTVKVPKAKQDLVMSISPSVVDRLSVYYLPAGDASAWTAVDLASRSAQLETALDLAPGLQTVYLRVSSKGFVFHPVIQTHENFIKRNQVRALVSGSVIAAYALMVLILLFLKTVRQSSLPFFILLHITVCVLSYIALHDTFVSSFGGYADITKWYAQGVTMTGIGTFLLLLDSFFGYVDMRQAQRGCRWMIGISLMLTSIIYGFAGEQAFQCAVLVNLCIFLVLNLALFSMAVMYVLRQRTMESANVLLAGSILSTLAVVTWVVLQFLGVIAATPLLFIVSDYRPLCFTALILIFLWGKDKRAYAKYKASQSKMQSAQLLAEGKSRRLETQMTFTAMLMHELKSPLYTIQLAALSLSQREALSQTDAKRLDNINRSADDINYIIDTCVKAERLELGTLPVKMLPVQIASLQRELLQPAWEDRLVFSGLTSGKVQADFQCVRIVLANLVSNAIKYSPPGSPVELNVQADPHAAVASVCFRVTNTVGSAGRPDALKVFTRYYSGNSSDKENSVGLGLWLAQTIALKMGAQLHYSSDDSTVNFYFTLELC